MIVEGLFQSKKRSELDGKPFTFDISRDFFRLKVRDSPVAFSDYLPRQSNPDDYIIVDFDKEGRVVGYGVDGLMRMYLKLHPFGRLQLLFMNLRLGANAVSLATNAVNEVGKRILVDAVPTLDSQGRLPAFASSQ